MADVNVERMRCRSTSAAQITCRDLDQVTECSITPELARQRDGSEGMDIPLENLSYSLKIALTILVWTVATHCSEQPKGDLVRTGDSPLLPNRPKDSAKIYLWSSLGHASGSDEYK